MQAFSTVHVECCYQPQRGSGRTQAPMVSHQTTDSTNKIPVTFPTLSPPATEAQPWSLPSTFLLVDDPQHAGVPDKQMPVAEDAEGAAIHVGEVEEIVEVVGAHGAEDGEELEGQVGGHLGGRAEEVAQGPGAGADHQPPAGAQVPREGPPLHVGEDLQGRGGMGGIVPALRLVNPAHRPTSLPLRGLSSAPVSLCFAF